MFRGRSRHTLDPKGRLAVPTRFRDVLEQKGEDCLVVTNHDRCLWAFARSDWQTIEEEAAKLPRFDQSVNIYLRYFISGAVECPVKHWRITIPPDLREIGELSKEVVLVGQLSRFEIWDKQKWEEEFQRARDRFAEASQSLSQLGL
jgi:MraZ protein